MTRARDTLEGLLALHLGERWRYACSYGLNSLENAAAWCRREKGDAAADAFVAAVRAAWPQQCREEYELARGYAGCSHRLFGEHGRPGRARPPRPGHFRRRHCAGGFPHTLPGVN